MSTPAQLPAMTDPLGAHWQQPKDLHKRVALIDGKAHIARSDFMALLDYSRSRPSGVYAGKVWRGEDHHGTLFIGFYTDGYMNTHFWPVQLTWLPPTPATQGTAA